VTKKGVDGAAEIRVLMARLRANAPKKIGPRAVTAIGDYDAQVRRAADGTTAPLSLPRSNVLAFELEGGSRIIARPSGTEPKIKFYFDVREPVRDNEPIADADSRAARTMKTLEDEFVAITT
jgi:phosphomannomutase